MFYLKVLIKLDPNKYLLAKNKPNKDMTTIDKGLYCYYFPLVDDESDLESDSDKE